MNVLKNTKNVFKNLKCIENIICTFKDIVMYIICFQVHTMYCEMYEMYSTTSMHIMWSPIHFNTFRPARISPETLVYRSPAWQWHEHPCQHACTYSTRNNVKNKQTINLSISLLHVPYHHTLIRTIATRYGSHRKAGQVHKSITMDVPQIDIY
jgi:hypothetical protein